MDYLKELFTVVGGASAFAAALAWCIKKMIETPLAEAMEAYKASLAFNDKKREKAALVAELLATWSKRPLDVERMNKLTWEATMWLPEDEAAYLNQLLSHGESRGSKELIVKVRELIQGTSSKIKAEDVVSFSESP